MSQGCSGDCGYASSSELLSVLICRCCCSYIYKCSRDPNVRKQKYLQSGQRYFDEASIAKLRSNLSMLSRSTIATMLTTNWRKVLPQDPEVVERLSRVDPYRRVATG